MHKVIFLDDILLVEKRVFLWYDTETDSGQENLKTERPYLFL